MIRLKHLLKEAADIVITKIKDIPNLQKLVDAGQVTYRGLPSSNAIVNKIYAMTNDEGATRIKVNGNEYYITKSDFEKLGGIKKIRFGAPYRKLR
jgi:hypothetical protein